MKSIINWAMTNFPIKISYLLLKEYNAKFW